MKRKIFTMLALVLTLAALMCATAFAVSAADAEPSVTIAKFNLAFEDNTYLKYAVRFDGVNDEKINENNIGMLYWTDYADGFVPGTEDYSSKTMGYTEISGVKHYTFEYRHISAKQMTDYIYSVAYVELDGVKYYSAPAKYSVLDYAYSRLGKTGVATDNEDLKNLLVATLEQGAMAQKYFRYNTDRLANAEYYLIEVVDGTLEDGFTKGLYHSDEKAIVTAYSTLNDYCYGWQNSIGTVVSRDNPAELTYFWKNETYYPLWEYIEPEQEIIYTRDGDYIYFGEYPQTIKESHVRIIDTVDRRGYYLGSDGEYYAEVTAWSLGDDYTFSTGENVIRGETYYFKVEPIRWRILEENDGEVLILCDSIIANKRFDHSTSNYAESEIRAWLNKGFYNEAFNDLQKELILTTTVDNRECEDTNDKLFLLSLAEATNPAYGFQDGNFYDVAKRMLTSDYTRAKGAKMAVDSWESQYYGNGIWWLRSPDDSVNPHMDIIYHNGSTMVNYIDGSGTGVVPALRMKL